LIRIKGKILQIKLAMSNFKVSLFKGPELTGEAIEDGIRVPYMLSAGSYLLPRMDKSGNLELLLQEAIEIKPYETVKKALGIKFGIPKGYRACVMRSSELPPSIYGPLDLLSDEYGDYFFVAIQNCTSN
jgi:hypothetical protein